MQAEMRKNLLSIILFTLLNFIVSHTHAQIQIGSTQADTLSVVTGLNTPWEILWGPDNFIWFTERGGKISRLNPETGELFHLITIPGVHEESESGLLGMALHPDFSNTPHVFVAYTYFSEGIWERIVRYNYNGSVLENQVILLDNIAGSGNHNGSRLVFDNNLKLYVTTGDATNTSTAQDLNSLNGKTLRMNPDGSVPADNPISGSLLWSWGHRNHQGLVIAPDGKMYSSEHGPNNDDELNLIEKGNNYGWPDVHGFCNTASEEAYCNVNSIIEPLFAWTPTLAVAGIDYYNHDALPEWKNTILVTGLKERELVSLTLSEDGQSITKSSKWFDNVFGRLRDICVSPDGRVFLAVSNLDGRGSPKAGDDRIVQVKAKEPSSNAHPIVSNQISVYPNPVQNTATVVFHDEIKNGRISVFDYSGKLVFTDNFSGKEYFFNRKNLSSGYYIIEMKSTEFTATTYLLIF